MGGYILWGGSKLNVYKREVNFFFCNVCNCVMFCINIVDNKNECMERGII